MKILVRDESLTGKVAHEFQLELETPTLTVRELIRKRVYEEVRILNANRGTRYSGLFEPRAEELLLNPGDAEVRKINAETKAKDALKAFDMNGFLLLVDNKQYSDPEEEICLKPDATVSFIKLTPLVGG